MHSMFGKGFIDGAGLGARGFGLSRKLASSDLRLLILHLLEHKPRHGYEVIKELDERSKGFYVPSPGMVYPALTLLEESGHTTAQAAGTRKLYSVTEAGRRYLNANRSMAEALFAQFARVADRMDRVRRAMDTEEPRHGSEQLRRAHLDLDQALMAKADSSKEEQQRIALILQRAVAEIAGR